LDTIVVEKRLLILVKVLTSFPIIFCSLLAATRAAENDLGGKYDHFIGCLIFKKVKQPFCGDPSYRFGWGAHGRQRWVQKKAQTPGHQIRSQQHHQALSSHAGAML
jgi:hypothetical protein